MHTHIHIEHHRCIPKDAARKILDSVGSKCAEKCETQQNHTHILLEQNLWVGNLHQMNPSTSVQQKKTNNLFVSRFRFYRIHRRELRGHTQSEWEKRFRSENTAIIFQLVLFKMIDGLQDFFIHTLIYNIPRTPKVTMILFLQQIVCRSDCLDQMN